LNPEEFARGAVSVGSFGFGDPESEAHERAGSGHVDTSTPADDPEQAAHDRSGHGSVSKGSTPDSAESAAKDGAKADSKPAKPVRTDRAEQVAADPEDTAQSDANASAKVDKPKV
jgi:hypothetical protein